MKKIKSQIKLELLEKLTLISLKLELVEWASFFILEMKTRKFIIKKTIMDEYIQLNLNKKITNAIFPPGDNLQPGRKIRLLKNAS